MTTKPLAALGEWRDNQLPSLALYPNKSLVAGDASPSMLNGLPLIQLWTCEMAEWPDLICGHCEVSHARRPLRGEAYVHMCSEGAVYLCVKHRMSLPDSAEASLRHHCPSPQPFALHLYLFTPPHNVSTSHHSLTLTLTLTLTLMHSYMHIPHARPTCTSHMHASHMHILHAHAHPTCTPTFALHLYLCPPRLNVSTSHHSRCSVWSRCMARARRRW